jgi:hypothetical protein
VNADEQEIREYMAREMAMLERELKYVPTGRTITYQPPAPLPLRIFGLIVVALLATILISYL